MVVAGLVIEGLLLSGEFRVESGEFATAVQGDGVEGIEGVQTFGETCGNAGSVDTVIFGKRREVGDDVIPFFIAGLPLTLTPSLSD